MSRYARQMILPELGDAGQKALCEAHILVIGAGGLASPVLQYLAGAGIGQITLVDGDCVEVGNLHRQTLFNHTCIGQPKAQAAARILNGLNPDCTVMPVKGILDPENVDNFLKGVDLVLDCADSFAASYILSDACFDQNIPLISASALGLTGYVGGFCGTAPSLRAVFPDLPNRAENCASAGVLGPVVGVIGAMQAQMALAVLTGMDPSPLGQMVQFDGHDFRTTSFRFNLAPEPPNPTFRFIARSQIRSSDFVVELRDNTEAPTPAAPHAIRQTVDAFGTTGPKPAHQTRAVFCCKSGLRAWQAATRIQPHWDGQIVLAALGNT